MPSMGCAPAALPSADAHASAARDRARSRHIPAAHSCRPLVDRRLQGDETSQAAPPAQFPKRSSAWRGKRQRCERRRVLQCFDLSILQRFQRRRFFVTDAAETNAIAGPHLADFPQLGFGDRDGTHEAAEARTVARQNHRTVAGEVDAADRILAVVNVGRMQAGFAAVAASPPRASDRSGARPSDWSCSAPPIRRRTTSSIESLREEVRRAVRAIQHGDVPQRWIVRNQVRPAAAAERACRSVRRGQWQHVTGSQVCARRDRRTDPARRSSDCRDTAGTSKPLRTAR